MGIVKIKYIFERFDFMKNYEHFKNNNDIIIFSKTDLREYELVGIFETIEEATKYICIHEIPGDYIISQKIS